MDTLFSVSTQRVKRHFFWKFSKNPRAISDHSAPVVGRRHYVHDAYGNKISLQEAVRLKIIDAETAKAIIEKDKSEEIQL